MQFTVDRAAFVRALIVTARVVERRSTIPILSNLRLDASDGRVTIKGTDLDIEASSACAAVVDEPGAITVPAKTVEDIARKLPDGAQINVDTSKAGALVIKSGRARFSVPTLPADDYPDFTAGELHHHFTLPVSDVIRMVAECSFAISTEETRYYLNGIFLHAPTELDRHEGLRAVATDGHRLVRLSLPRPVGAEGMPGLILPRKLVTELGKLSNVEGEAMFEVGVSTTKVRFARGDNVLVSKVIDGTFPDYGRVIPEANPNLVAVAGAELAAAVDRVASVSSSRTRAVKLTVEESRIGVSQRDPDCGAGDDEVDATLDGKPVEIGFNGKYLGEILSLLDAETVEMALADPGSPAVITRKGDEALLVVLMPMRC